MKNLPILSVTAFLLTATLTSLSADPPATKDSGLRTQSSPLLTYNAISDTEYYPKPELPKLGPAPFIFKDPTFSCPMVRVTDEKTASGLSMHTPSGSVQNTWNTDSTLFITSSEGGRAIPFQFDPKTLKASRIPGLDTIPNIAGNVPFSYTDKNICYGKDITRTIIVRFDFQTKKSTDICNVTKITDLPVVSDHLGMFTVSANDIICVCFGGPRQNTDMYCLVYDVKNNTHHLWNTKDGTIDGKPIPGAPSVLMHACAIDLSGRYVSATITGLWYWDTQTNALFQIPDPNGHRAFGFGEMVNSSGFIYRTLDEQGRQSPKSLFSQHGFTYDTHTSWNNAREGIHVPCLVSSEHAEELGDPKSPCGDEVFAVATNGSGKIWRFCHTRTLLHAPSRPAAGPASRNAAATQRTRPQGDDMNFWDTPRGNVSQDGQFFMFNSNWEGTLGKDRVNRPRQDVFIVKLDRETDSSPTTEPVTK